MKDEYSEEKLGRFWIRTNVRHITNAKFNFLILILWNHKMPLTILTLVRCMHTLQRRISSMWWKIISHLRQIHGPRLRSSPHMFHFPCEQISPSSTEKCKVFLSLFKDFVTDKLGLSWAKLSLGWGSAWRYLTWITPMGVRQRFEWFIWAYR